MRELWRILQELRIVYFSARMHDIIGCAELQGQIFSWHPQISTQLLLAFSVIFYRASTAPPSSPRVHWKCWCRKYTRLEGIEHIVLQKSATFCNWQSGRQVSNWLSVWNVYKSLVTPLSLKHNKEFLSKWRCLINGLSLSFRLNHMENALSILQEVF